MHARRAWLALLCGAVLAAPCAADADVLPATLTGVWAAVDSVFDKGQLIGGTALYLLPGGRVALVGAPLPVRYLADGTRIAPIIGIAGDASFESTSGRLVITLRDGDKQAVVAAQYDAAESAIQLPEQGQGIQRLLRREMTVPPALEQMLKAGR